MSSILFLYIVFVKNTFLWQASGFLYGLPYAAVCFRWERINRIQGWLASLNSEEKIQFIVQIIALFFWRGHLVGEVADVGVSE